MMAVVSKNCVKYKYCARLIPPIFFIISPHPFFLFFFFVFDAVLFLFQDALRELDIGIWVRDVGGGEVHQNDLNASLTLMSLSEKRQRMAGYREDGRGGGGATGRGTNNEPSSSIKS